MYDETKITNLGALKDLATRVKTDFATKKELESVPIPEYTIAKQSAAEAGYLATYYLTKGGEQVGEKINIPKDFLVNSAEILEVETKDQPYDGAQVGDLYIDFVINSKDGGDTASHIYLPVNDLVDAYTGGNGIEVSAANVISAKIDSANANGLGVTASGLKLAIATSSSAGAMSASDKAKLDGVATGANKYVHPSYTEKSSGLYKVTVDATGHVSAASAVAKSDITALGIPAQDTTYGTMGAATSSTAGKAGLVPAPAAGAQAKYLRGDGTWQTPTNTTYSEATTSKAGLMSAADKTKLDGLVIADDSDVQEMLDEVFGADA